MPAGARIADGVTDGSIAGGAIPDGDVITGDPRFADQHTSTQPHPNDAERHGDGDGNAGGGTAFEHHHAC